MAEEKREVVLAWCDMKIAECDQRVSMAKMVNMERTAAADARDARFFRAVVSLLGARPLNPSADGDSNG